jgi:hypothetical protein
MSRGRGVHQRALRHETSTDLKTLERVRVCQIAVPMEARALSTLSRIDYEDAFLVDVGPVSQRTAEQWARAVVEEAPASVQRTLQSGWVALGIELRGGAPDCSVLGWPIRHSTPEVVVLGTRSPIGLEGELLFKRHEHRLLFATFIQHDRDAGRGAWATIEPMHAPLVRRILEQASRRCSP